MQYRKCLKWALHGFSKKQYRSILAINSNLTNEEKFSIVKQEIREGRYTGTIDIPSMYPIYRYSKYEDTIDERLFRVKVNTILWMGIYRNMVKLILN